MSVGAILGPPETFEALKDRLIEIEPNLPKRLRQAAAYALEHPDEFALGTASGVARSADVQASRWCASPRRSVSPASQTCRRCSVPPAQSLARLFRRLKALHETARDSGDRSIS